MQHRKQTRSGPIWSRSSVPACAHTTEPSKFLRRFDSHPDARAPRPRARGSREHLPALTHQGGQPGASPPGLPPPRRPRLLGRGCAWAGPGRGRSPGAGLLPWQRLPAESGRVGLRVKRSQQQGCSAPHTSRLRSPVVCKGSAPARPLRLPCARGRPGRVRPGTPLRARWDLRPEGLSVSACARRGKGIIARRHGFRLRGVQPLSSGW